MLTKAKLIELIESGALNAYLGGTMSDQDIFDAVKRMDGVSSGLDADKFKGNDTIPIANGGTGQTTAAAARNALGLGNTTGALPAANGGTGLTSLQAARNAMGLGDTTGALPIANGGTGQTTAAAARNALGLGNTAGALPVANGGTGGADAATARSNLGAADASHNHALTALTGTLTVAKGGTGATSVAAAQDALGIADGTNTCSASTGRVITFPFTFSAAPKVIACWSTTGANVSGDFGALKVHSITTTGCTVIAGGSTPSTVQDFAWIAIGPR